MSFLGKVRKIANDPKARAAFVVAACIAATGCNRAHVQHWTPDTPPGTKYVPSGNVIVQGPAPVTQHITTCVWGHERTELGEIHGTFNKDYWMIIDSSGRRIGLCQPPYDQSPSLGSAPIKILNWVSFLDMLVDGVVPTTSKCVYKFVGNDGQWKFYIDKLTGKPATRECGYPLPPAHIKVFH